MSTIQNMSHIYPGGDFFDLLLHRRELLYTLFIVVTGAAVRYLNEVLKIPVPYTVVVFFAGMIFGLLPAGSIFQTGPLTLITVFIPVLIFEGSFFIDIYIFKEIFLQVLLLAIPALVVMITLTAVSSIYLFHFDYWTWTSAFVFGSILSATDPVAVIAIMKELGASKQLSLLVEGESMLNDGTAMIFFDLFLELLTSPKALTRYDILFDGLKIFWISCGGPLFGFCMAMVAVMWLQRTFNDSLTEICITLAMSYLTFYIANYMIMVSGVLAVVTFGVVVGDHRTCISPEVENSLHSFWETLAFIANTCIFALCGLIISKRALSHAQPKDFIVLIILYVIVQCIRLITVFMFMPLLKRIGSGLTWQDGLICSWSGLRGAVGLALALLVYKTMKDQVVGEKILFNVSLIVVATLLINATTIAGLMSFLGLSNVTAVRKQSMAKAIQILDQSMQNAIEIWKIDRFLTNADWDTVCKLCAIEDPYRITETLQEKEQRERTQVTCPQCHTIIPYVPTASEIEKKKVEAVSKFVKLLKRSYWRQFEKGILSGTGLRKLLEMAEGVSHTEMVFLNIKNFRSFWRAKQWMRTWITCIRRNSVSFPTKVFDENSRLGQGRRTFYLFSKHWMLLFIVCGTDTMVSYISLFVCIMDWNTPYSDAGLNNANVLTVSYIILFFIFRIVMFKERFVRTPWFVLSVTFIILIPLDIISSSISFDETLRHHCKFNVLFRALRVVLLLELVVHFIQNQLSSALYGKVRIACDIGRGFVRAHENALRMIENISDQENIQMAIKHASEAAKLDMLRELGILQGRHHNIAIEVKTCHAIRALFNVMREGMKKLMEEGGVDEIEGKCFIEVIESEMKHLKVAPPKISSPSVHKILANISWIGKNDKLIQYIKDHVKTLVFEYGDIVMKPGDESDGVYFIISGLLRLETDSTINAFTHTQYLTTGHVIGEISTLTGFKRSATLTCETVVKALFLPDKDFLDAIKLFTFNNQPLMTYLWKISAMRLAFSVLYAQPIYKMYRKETLLSLLEECTLFYVRDTNKFQITPSMKNMVLVIGRANGNDGKQYEGTCYIPPSVTWLRFPKEQLPSPLLLYNDSYQVTRSSKNDVFLLQGSPTPTTDMKLPDF